MKKYYIEVIERYSRIVTVEAENLEVAMKKIEGWANDTDGLDYEDFADRNYVDRTESCESKAELLQDCFYDIANDITEGI